MAGSPWGSIQHSKSITRGVRIVSTASHGGLMVTEAFAERHLSSDALKYGDRYSGYYCFEEDCAIEVALMDSPVILNALNAYRVEWDGKALTHEDLLYTVTMYYCDYLEARGIAPDPEAKKIYDDRKMTDKLRNERSPDLIICCWGDHETLVPGVNKVMTADDGVHYVQEEEYDRLRKSGVLLLSKLTTVNLPALTERPLLYVEHIAKTYAEKLAEIHSNGEQPPKYGPLQMFNYKFDACKSKYSFLLAEVDSSANSKKIEEEFKELLKFAKRRYPTLFEAETSVLVA